MKSLILLGVAGAITASLEIESNPESFDKCNAGPSSGATCGGDSTIKPFRLESIDKQRLIIETMNYIPD
jgi:hypothetical protein